MDRRMISRGLEKRGRPVTRTIIQTRYEQSPNGKTRVNPDIGARMRTRDNQQNKLD